MPNKRPTSQSSDLFPAIKGLLLGDPQLPEGLDLRLDLYLLLGQDARPCLPRHIDLWPIRTLNSVSVLLVKRDWWSVKCPKSV